MEPRSPYCSIKSNFVLAKKGKFEVKWVPSFKHIYVHNIEKEFIVLTIMSDGTIEGGSYVNSIRDLQTIVALAKIGMKKVYGKIW